MRVAKIAQVPLVLAAAALTVLIGAPSGSAAESAPAAGPRGFRLPSGNIACAYVRPTLRCDILTGLAPEPRRACELDWTGVSVGVTARATATCAGDTVYDPSARTLAYGKRWKRDGLTCVSQRSGLRCRNRSGRGFVLARGRWRTF